MSISIILGTALAFLFIVLLIREIEIRKRKPLYVTLIINNLDPVCDRAIKKSLKWVFKVVSVSDLLILKKLLPIVHSIGKHLHFKVHTTVKDAQKMLKGRKKLSNSGSVNFFFHSVGEHKKTVSKDFSIED